MRSKGEQGIWDILILFLAFLGTLLYKIGPSFRTFQIFFPRLRMFKVAGKGYMHVNFKPCSHVLVS